MQLTKFRQRLFMVIALVLAVAAVEAGSCLILSVVEGRLMTWSRSAELRRERITPDEVPLDREIPEDQSFGTQVIHPYLGYVHDRSFMPRRYDPVSQDHGFIQNRHSLFQEPSPDKLVVAVMGGSVARSVTVHQEALRKALEKSRRFAGRKIVVLSLAKGGYKQPQQLIVLNYMLSLGAHFDLVVNLDGFNEITLAVQNVHLGTYPFFPQEWSIRVGDLGLEQRRRVGELTYLRSRRQAWAEFFSRAPWRFSLAANLVWRSFDNVWTSRIHRAQGALRSETGTMDDYQAQGPKWTHANRKAMFRQLVAAWSRASQQMDVLCRGMGIEYHHFLQPNQYFEGSKPLSAEELNIAWKEKSMFRPSVEDGYPVLVRWGRQLAESGVAFHDLTGIFEDHPETLYRDACCHLNPLGNELLAQAMVDAIDAAMP